MMITSSQQRAFLCFCLFVTYKITLKDEIMGSLRYTDLAVGDSLAKFTIALKMKQSVTCDRAGIWHCEHWFKTLIVRKLLALDNSRIMHLTRVFNACLDEREQQIVPSDHSSHQSYFNAGQALIESIQKCNSVEGRFLTLELRRRLSALAYRAGITEIPITLASPGATANRIMMLAEAWKKKFFYSTFDKALLNEDRKQLDVLSSRYENLSSLIIEEQEAKDNGRSQTTPLQDKCFDWILRNHNAANIYAEYPGMVIMLGKSRHEANLAKRVGYFRGSPLRIHSDRNIKTLQMRVMTKNESDSKYIAADAEPSWVPINDPKTTVTMRSGQVYTVEKIIEIFANKDFGWATLEVLGDCNNDGLIDEWHCGEMAATGVDGKRTPINLDLPNWWDQLPDLKWLSVDEVQKKHPKLNLDEGRNWVSFAMATRMSEILEPRGTHAYTKIYIPDPILRNGIRGYKIQVFGFYPKEEYFPQTLSEMAKFPFKSVPGEVAYPDPSIFAHERQQGGYVEIMTPDVATLDMMKRLKHRIERGRKGHLVYSMLGNKNCANFTISLLEKYGFPNKLYHTTFESSRPVFPCDLFFRCLNKMPKSLKNWCFRKIVRALGGNSSATSTRTKKDGTIVTKTISMSLEEYEPFSEKNEKQFQLPAVALVFHNPGND